MGGSVFCLPLPPGFMELRSGEFSCVSVRSLCCLRARRKRARPPGPLVAASVCCFGVFCLPLPPVLMELRSGKFSCVSVWSPRCLRARRKRARPPGLLVAASVCCFGVFCPPLPAGFTELRSGEFPCVSVRSLCCLRAVRRKSARPPGPLVAASVCCFDVFCLPLPPVLMELRSGEFSCVSVRSPRCLRAVRRERARPPGP